jgi:predicted nucleic acid-binding Zn ribbon protein
LRRKGQGTVGESLKEYFGRRGLVRRIRDAGVVNEWAGLVGEQVARVTEPDSVDRNGTLRVRVRSAAWMQELQLMSPTIIKELARKGRRVKRIHWMLGSGEERPEGAPRGTPPAPGDASTRDDAAAGDR